MPQVVGVWLRERRADRGLSLGGLALKSGVSKATLSRWEAGACLPGVADLEAVLHALGASRGEHAGLLAQMDRPRAIHRLRLLEPSDPGPAGADLLRALRLRHRWTQAKVAARAGIPRGALARWETGDSWPAAERLHTLALALHATAEEVAVLTTAGPSIPALHLAGSDSLETLVIAWFELCRHRYFHVASFDLGYLLVEAQARSLARQEPRAREMLAEIYAFHAQQLCFQRRYAEAEVYARRVLRLSPGPHAEAHPRWLNQVRRAIAVSVTAAGSSGRQPAPERALEFLRDWPHEGQTPEFEAWLLRMLADQFSKRGDVQAALRFSARACERAARADPIELWLRRRDHSRLLLQLGRAREAAESLPCEGNGTVWDIVDYRLQQAETLLAVGDETGARASFDHAARTIEAWSLDFCREPAAALARRFGRIPPDFGFADG